MTKPTPTRTLNPLPFGDLEPKRFEDLVRNLIYDFRPWRQLEATGRTGADDGYDVRGWEITIDPDQIAGDNEETENSEPPNFATDQRWLIQCKREKVIGPKLLAKYLDNVSPKEWKNLHGFIFAACCDFSKASRDLFRDRCRKEGVRECFIWAKSEVEDLLLQPKNDGLLFAFFGISLQIRKRNVRTALRARLAMKRKASKTLEEGRHILLREPDETTYPYRGDLSRNALPWMVARCSGLRPQGVGVIWGEYQAYLAPDGEHWDAAGDGARLPAWSDPWMPEEEEAELENNRRAIGDFLDKNAPENCRGLLRVEAVIPFEEILDIDAEGDEVFDGPHLYVPFSDRRVWLCGAKLLVRPPICVDENKGRQFGQGRELHNPEHGNRIEFFPAEYRYNPSL